MPVRSGSKYHGYGDIYAASSMVDTFPSAVDSGWSVKYARIETGL